MVVILEKTDIFYSNIFAVYEIFDLIKEFIFIIIILNKIKHLKMSRRLKKRKFVFNYS